MSGFEIPQSTPVNGIIGFSRFWGVVSFVPRTRAKTLNTLQLKYTTPDKLSRIKYNNKHLVTDGRLATDGIIQTSKSIDNG